MSEQKAFAWTSENEDVAKKHIAKYPEGRQQSAVMPLLDLAQRQNNGHLTQEIIEYIASYLDMPSIRVLEVATFYTMYNHKPVGKFHLQVCGTTPCWLRGSDQIFAAIREKLGIEIGETTADGMFTLSEVECAGACVNAPVVAINDDYFEDLTPESIGAVIDKLTKGEGVKFGPQNGRHTSEPEGGATTLKQAAAAPEGEV